MSHIDLSKESPPKEICGDICIIGAGAAGIYIATKLVERGKSVILVEAGPVKSIATESIGFEQLFTRDEYSGALDGRYFGVGGSTSNWGGNLIPHSEFDNQDDDSSETWESILNSIEKNSQEVLNRLGYKKDPNFDNYANRILGSSSKILSKAGFFCQSSLLIPFSKKNMRHLLKKNLFRRNKLKLIFNAVAKEWLFSSEESRSIEKLVSISKNKNKAVIKANKFIVTAGALESTRILLEINQCKSSYIFPEDSDIGLFLGDHLSVPIADVAEDDNKAASKLFSPHFDGQWMRGLRFIKNDKERETPRAFMHFEFDNQSQGFQLVKDIFQAIQSRKFPKIRAKTLITGMIDIIKLAYFRYFKSRLYISNETKSHLQLDIEQHRSVENRVALIDDLDIYGRRKLKISWSVNREDMDNIKMVAEGILDLWPNADSDLPRLIPRELDFYSRKPHDAYHPVGTCRMGLDKKAVVDFELKVKGLDNLWSVSTAVLPSAGTANPTFSILCLGNKLASELK